MNAIHREWDQNLLLTTPDSDGQPVPFQMRRIEASLSFHAPYVAWHRSVPVPGTPIPYERMVVRAFDDSDEIPDSENPDVLEREYQLFLTESWDYLCNQFARGGAFQYGLHLQLKMPNRSGEWKQYHYIYFCPRKIQWEDLIFPVPANRIS